MPHSVRLVTAEELERFPDDDYRYELFEGRVIRMSPVGYEHGRTVIRLGALLERHVRRRRLGVVLTEVGFKLRSNPDTVRAPDLAFIRQARLPPSRRGFWHGVPDLAVEVLSPDDQKTAIRVKVAEYLDEGVPLVVVIDPDRENVTVHAQSRTQLVLRSDDVLNLDPVVKGFKCPVHEIFE